MTVSSSTNRVSYSGNGSNTTFAYTFKVFDQDDLTVILRAADGTETTQTITTHYSVTGVGNAGGGNVVFVTAPAATETVVILREQGLVQELDLVPNDPFPAGSLEDALDKIIFMVQQHEETLGRTIKASKTNTITGAEFTISAADRANKIFAFDGSGDVSITQEIGTYRGDWAASMAYNPRDIVKDTDNNNIYIANTAHTSSGTVPISSNADVAKWDLLVDAASATASAAAASASEIAAEAAQTAAEAAQSAAESAQTDAETAQTAAEAAQAAAETAYDNFDDRYLGDKASDPALDNDGDALLTGALYYNTTDDVMKVYSGSAWSNLKISPAEQANIDTVAASIADVSTVAGIDTDVTAVAAIDADVTTVSGIAANVTTVAGISANVTTVAGISANVVTVSGISANIATVAGDSADITTVATNIGDVNIVAANISGIADFADTYVVSATEPVSPIEGTLWFDTSTDIMKVYNGSSFQAAGSSVNGTSERQSYTATNGQTTFAATYDAGYVDVYLNGVKLVDGTDFTATDGSNVVLASGAALNDTVDIVAYGTFELADVYTKTASDARYVQPTHTGDVSITGEFTSTSYNETYAAVTSTSNATTIDCEAGNVFSHTLSENTTFTFSNPPASGTAYGMTIRVVQDASASGYTLTWPASVDWASATAPTLTADADAVDVFGFFTVDGGTTWYGFTAGQAMG